MRELLQCASTCSRQLRAAFPCRAAATAPGSDAAKGRRLSKGRRLEHLGSILSPSARRKAERRLSAGSGARPTPAAAAVARPSRRLRDQRAGRTGANVSRLQHLSSAVSAGRALRRGRDKEQEQDKGSSKDSGSKESYTKDKAKDKAAPLNCPYLSLVRCITRRMCTACAILRVRCMCTACALHVRCMCAASAMHVRRCVCAACVLLAAAA